ncbi:tudor domain-containing protein 7A-like [Argiope bruennichi]|uniref:tudor domain-containing protein 7A-like n=1 Tax=Argiope bruennichi TaxID=94029 RepID=UPI002495741A|nr:tudor domain-containing protein 7A-like [Argiope bruennichi]XP_055939249.1 tudor domain-containing protein 7A-like [Argiope bruennichi]
MDRQELKESVLLNLRSVTQSCKGGVPLYRLERDYKDLLGTPIPFRELGYNSLEAFIQDIPDVISLKRNREGLFMAEGVADAATAHIASLVSRQKQAKPSVKGSRKTYFSKGRGGFSSRYRPRGGRSSYGSSSSVPLQPSGKAYKQDKVSYENHSKNSVPTSKSPLLPSPKANSAFSRLDRPVRKNEIAPRFIRLNQRRMEAAATRKYSPPRTPPDRYSPSPRASPKGWISPRPSAIDDESYNQYNGNRIQNTPRPLLSRNNFGRLDRFKQQLENARTNKEYVEIYAKANGYNFKYKTIFCGQKKKGFVSNLELDKKTYQSYPEVARTEEEAEEIAAKAAVEDIKSNTDSLASLPETPISNAGEIQILLSRIEEIVYSKPTGMFINGIVREYENKFNESLPNGWMDILRQSSVVIMEEVAVKFGKVPDGTNFIVKVNKNSSGSTTPSEASSKVNAELLDLDNGDFSSKDDFEDFYQPQVPELTIPDGNEWAVYITNTSSALAARLIDHDADFYNMSKAMSAFYDSQTLPVQVVYERHLYAAVGECINDELVMHRVLVNRVFDNDIVECYFVDEGTFGEIPKSDLQELHEDFLMVPYQAVYFSLEGLDDFEPYMQPEHLESLLYKTFIAVVKRSCSSIEEFLPDDPGVHHIVYSVLLYDTSDNENDICINDFVKKLLIHSLECKFPKPGVSSRGYLTHVTKTGEIYLRFLHPENSWLEIELQKHSKKFEQSCQGDIRLEPGKMYAAKYPVDGKWYRAQVSNSTSIVTDPQMVEVIFIDYGHPSLVKKSEVCELEPYSEFLASLGPQAINCELHNALPSPNNKWTVAASVKLIELAPFNEELIVRVIIEGDSKSLPKVSLHKRIYNKEDSFIISINETLASRLDASVTEPVAAAKVPTQLNLHHNVGSHLSKGSSMSDFVPRVATPVEESLINSIRKTSVSTPSNDGIDWLMTPENIKSPDAYDDESPAPLNPPVVPNKGEIFDVYVTMAATPQNFVVQPLKSAPQMTELMRQMNQFYSIEENLIDMHPTLLKENGYYAALHSQDNSWYRVQLLSVSPSEPYLAAVYYVDFGDINTVTLQNLQKLWNQFRNLPCQAIKATLSGVLPKEMDWRAEHCIQFKNMVTEKMFVAIVQNKDLIDESDSSVKVELILIDTSTPDKDIYIHELLIEKEMARPAPIK